MKFLVGCLLSAFLSCFFYNLHAQVNVTAIRGKILAENNLSAEGATVILIKYKDSSIVNTAAAGTNGAFQFTNINADDYLILVSKAGCEKLYSGPYPVKSGQMFTTPDIFLKLTIQKLSGVTINSTRPELEAQPGKLIVNVQNSLSAQGNSAFDILRETPGVRVDNSNNINIIGRQNALITINDVPTSLTGEDLASVLRGIQANTIDKIELITAGSAKNDAATGGIINIILKKGKNTGFNGSFTGVAGYGKYYKSNAAIVFNDRTDKVNIFGNYSITKNKELHAITTDRDVDFNEILSRYHSDYKSLVDRAINNFGFGADFYLSKTQTIGFLVDGSVTNNDFVKNNFLKIYHQSVFDSTVIANSSPDRNITRINYNINYSGKLDSAGKTLSANINYTTNNRSSTEYITNTFFDASGNQSGPPLLLQNSSPSNIRQMVSMIDFADPVSKTSKFEAGLKFSNVVSVNNLLFGPQINGVYTSDPKYSDYFKYTENVNAAYADYQTRMNKFDLTVGLRTVQTIAKGNSDTWGQVVNYNYIDLLPSLLMAYKADDKNEYSLSLNRTTKRPGYEDVNPFLYYIDLYDYRSGNPNLRPEYTTNIELTYSHNKSFAATLYSNVTTEAYEFRYYVQNDTTKVNINIPKNFGTIYNWGLRLLTPVTFTNWWRADFKLDASYQRYVAYPQNGNLNKGTKDIILSGSQSFKISNSISAGLIGFYESPSFYGISQFKANYYADGYISTQLFDKRGTLKLSMTDIFNTLRDRFNTNYQNLNFSVVDKIETQVLKLAFTYRFGKTAFKTIAHPTGNEEEQNRLNSKEN
ncbi:TonB-dependent receptor [uncultured Mucilaginibacter sp.]|uniref:TonB-dependent receptor n=1 Tax=uncultured Mucilaginibacter sp. TaxID=797541 RepID=UPI0025E5A142|nr:TonB-dependent receptor [uncultured Mucilaginibacter sp.]